MTLSGDPENWDRLSNNATSVTSPHGKFIICLKVIIKCGLHRLTALHCLLPSELSALLFLKNISATD